LYVEGSWVARLDIPLPGRHNLSNVVGALGACLMEGVSLAELEQAVTRLRPPGRRFDFRGLWRHRLIVDDYAHHPSEVSATLAMARLMVTSGQSPLPRSPQRLVAIFQPHRYSRTAEFLEGFAQALAAADLVLLAPLYAAGERPISGISSEQLADAIRRLTPELMVEACASLDALAARLVEVTQPDDLVLAMGAGDVNSLWDRLPKDPDRDAEPPDVPIAA
jgi:UDP-N-acetylmuramate--alanine ligase